MRRHKDLAEQKGISLESPPPPDGFKTKGVSTLYGPDGDVKAQWVKNDLDREKQQALMEETLSAFMEPLKGLAKPTKPPAKTSKDIFTEYIVTDLHLNALCWGEETGDDWDVRIAEEALCGGIDRLIDSTPPSERCLLNQMGDFFHADSDKPFTPESGNVLDTDTRFRKVTWVGVRALRYVTEKALRKHEIVEIRNTGGNHDPHASIVLDVAAKCYYENEPRVIVHDSPRAFWAYSFGTNLVGIGHGHAPKPNDMPEFLAADYPKEWGAAEFRYCRHGHKHSISALEKAGVVVEGFRTLAPKDAYHAARYRSGREAVAIVLDKDYGEIERHTAGIKRIMQQK